MPRHDARTEALIEALRACLGGRAAGIDLAWIAETGSTNSDLLERIRQTSADAPFRPALLVADRQTAGRGRHGRSWHAAPGASLTFSLAWPFADADLSGLSLAVGVALAEAIDPAGAAGDAALPASRIGLKWPNDLWLVGAAEAGRKLGGVLIETVPGNVRRVAVVGVGINVLAQAVAGASSGVAWLEEIEPGATAASLLHRVAPALIDALARFEGEGFGAFRARFAARDLLLGRSVRASAGAAEESAGGVEGVAVGVSERGELLVRTARGVEHIGSGEVSVRLARDPRGAPSRERCDEPARPSC